MPHRAAIANTNEDEGGVGATLWRPCRGTIANLNKDKDDVGATSDAEDRGGATTCSQHATVAAAVAAGKSAVGTDAHKQPHPATSQHKCRANANDDEQGGSPTLGQAGMATHSQAA